MASGLARDCLQLEIRVGGRVQGVGFRPHAWRLAQALGLRGDVRNDAEGVLVRVAGTAESLAWFVERLRTEAPVLARVDLVETRVLRGALPAGFYIMASVAGNARTQIAPDAVLCDDCAAEIADPGQRRFGYEFTNCTHCGPRFSITRAIPYDRAATSMADFVMCDACRAEYHDPANRRFHAEAIACPACGPRLHLGDEADPIGAAARLIRQGEILAIKGLGGYQLACDAGNADAVTRLRALKRRGSKPFALMARDLAVIETYCAVSTAEAALLRSPEAPIVLLDAHTPQPALAPGVSSLGFMLPTTPLHQLLLHSMDRPLVMTSGNFADAPQFIDDDAARTGLAAVTPHMLSHDRAILHRVDDSLARVVAGRPRVLRYARGYAPGTIALPPGFEHAPELLAMGGELKASFCMVKDGAALLSPHQGDLENAASYLEYGRNLDIYARLFHHAPRVLAADLHPEYLSSKLARDWAQQRGHRLIEVQHHHAHMAACLVENQVPLNAPRVLGVVLDGLGWGDDGSLWGGEFLLADYRGYQRLAHLKPVSMPGAAKAAQQPWRSLYAHLDAAMGWAGLADRFPSLALTRDLAQRPRAILDAMIAGRVNSPYASSCGRLFDAVAAALGICHDGEAYEGEAAARLEALAGDDGGAYPFGITGSILDPTPLWPAILHDLAAGVSQRVIAARFHNGLARAVVAMVVSLAEHGAALGSVALSGGCFQNRRLFLGVTAGLERAGFQVLTHSLVPCNDGGLALGQAVIAAARMIPTSHDFGRSEG